MLLYIQTNKTYNTFKLYKPYNLPTYCTYIPYQPCKQTCNLPTYSTNPTIIIMLLCSAFAFATVTILFAANDFLFLKIVCSESLLNKVRALNPPD